MGIFDAIGSFFHPERGYKEAEKALQAALERSRGAITPYSQAGLGQIPYLTGAEGQLLNPEEMYNRWASGYQESPYARQMQERAKESGLEAASSMGLMGSSAALGNLQQSAADITARDRQQYLDDLMRKYLAGIGIGQSLYGTGADMASRLAEMERGYGEQIAGARYGRETAPGGMFGKMLGTGIGMGVGGSLGGPLGAMYGASQGSKLFG